MNKQHWITIALTGELSESVLQDLADKSYSLVVSKLTRADKEALSAL
ncbi:MmcQ/YjbR family DNA-binding protein [Photobacterium indicum]